MKSEMEKRHEQEVRREAIRLGMVDLGPITTHTQVTQDTRDLRDPGYLGAVILASPLRPTEVADHLDANRTNTPNYSPKETLGQIATREYRAKMQRQAEEGDVAAVRVLLDHGWEVPSTVDEAGVAAARLLGSSEGEVIE